MKSMILAALTGAALVLGGCGNSEPERDTVTTVESFDSGPSFTATEDEFLYDVSQHMTPALHNEPQADVVELGYSICGAYEAGANIDQIVAVGMDNGLTQRDTVVIAAAAAVNFCPEYR